MLGLFPTSMQNMLILQHVQRPPGCQLCCHKKKGMVVSDNSMSAFRSVLRSVTNSLLACGSIYAAPSCSEKVAEEDSNFYLLSWPRPIHVLYNAELKIKNTEWPQTLTYGFWPSFCSFHSGSHCIYYTCTHTYVCTHSLHECSGNSESFSHYHFITCRI